VDPTSSKSHKYLTRSFRPVLNRSNSKDPLLTDGAAAWNQIDYFKKFRQLIAKCKQRQTHIWKQTKGHFYFVMKRASGIAY